jgi:hypothetical protein
MYLAGTSPAAPSTPLRFFTVIRLLMLLVLLRADVKYLINFIIPKNFCPSNHRRVPIRPPNTHPPPKPPPSKTQIFMINPKREQSVAR